MQTETIVDVHVDLYEARVISILELVSLALPFPLSTARPSLPRVRFVSFPYIHLLAFRDGRKGARFSRLSSGSRPRRIPRNNTKIFPGRSYVRTFLFGVYTTIVACARVCNVRAFTGCRWNTSVNISSRTGEFTIGAAVLSSWPPSLLIYSAHERCSQITVFFMMLLLHRRTHSFLR